MLPGRTEQQPLGRASPVARSPVTPLCHLASVPIKEQNIRPHHPALDDETNVRLNELCGFWIVDNDLYRIERAPEGGLMAENCRTGEEVAAPWVTIRGLPIDHPLAGRYP